MKTKEPLAHILVLFLLAPAWGGSGDLEITPGERQTFQKTIRINNFRKFINSEEKYLMFDEIRRNLEIKPQPQ